MKLTVSNANISNTFSTARMTLANTNVVESITLGNVSVTPSQITVGSATITPTAVTVPALVLGGFQFTGGQQGGIINYQEFSANGTWYNPYANASVNSALTGYEQVLVMAWGGGGGAASNNTIAKSGGGGACVIGYYTLSSLANTITVTVGPGGTASRTTTTSIGAGGGAGGNTSFGSLIAYGGAGTADSTGPGGGGGGTLGVGVASGSTGTGGAPLGGATGTSTVAGGISTFGGGGGANTASIRGGDSIFGGGGGAYGAGGGVGGNSVYGGAGGSIGASGASSIFGGDGGFNGTAGSIPGGGGSSNTSSANTGARGEVRVWVFGPAGTTAGAPTYALTANTTTLYQGSSILYTVSTTNVANGTSLYYTLNNSSTAVATDFTTAVNGSVVINGGTGTFTLTANNDADATNEAFTMDIRNTSTTGSIVASNASVSIIPNVSVINRGILATATNDASSYTYTNYNIGAATSTRRVIVVAFACNGTTGSRRISSITIGGIPATIDADGFDDRGGSGVVVCTIASATVPTGTTATIVVNYTGTMSRAAMYAVAIDNVENLTPIDTSIIGRLEPNHPHSLNIRNGGFMIGGAGTDSDGTTISWTNITERVESAVEGSGSRYGAADDLTNITETRSISVAIAAGARRVSALASYR